MPVLIGTYRQTKPLSLLSTGPMTQKALRGKLYLYKDPITSGQTWLKRWAMCCLIVGLDWTSAVSKIHGLRDVINSASNEMVDESSEQDINTSESSQLHQGISLLGLSQQQPPVIEGPLLNSCNFSVELLSGQLCYIYLQQVDPMVKILHRPSISKLMIHGRQYLGYPVGHLSVQAIRFSACYAAASSLTENQCQNMFQIKKSSLVAECRRVCEAAIENSGLLTTRDITVLQAFVLYLVSALSTQHLAWTNCIWLWAPHRKVARRSEERSRAVWTLLSIAVRIAKGLSLNVNSEKETFFYRQMRRRLWLTICLMDLQSSFGQASQPLIPLEESTSCFQLPAHINDKDYGIDTNYEIDDKEGLTDTTFSMMTYKLQLMGRLTNFNTRGDKDNSNQNGDSLTDTEMR